MLKSYHDFYVPDSVLYTDYIIQNLQPYEIGIETQYF